MSQDKLLEEMWKQQDSLEGPTATAPETPASPEANSGSEEDSKDSNPLLKRLRALEVKTSALFTLLFPQCFVLTYQASAYCVLFYHFRKVRLINMFQLKGERVFFV